MAVRSRADRGAGRGAQIHQVIRVRSINGIANAAEQPHRRQQLPDPVGRLGTFEICRRGLSDGGGIAGIGEETFVLVQRPMGKMWRSGFPQSSRPSASTP